MKNIVVLYHGDCMDGFSGAWVAWKKFGDKADYIPLKYQQPPLLLEDKVIYFIDFSYPEKDLKKLVANNKEIVLIDHHKTANGYIKIVSDSFFNLDHSGAVLAWKYFFPEKPVPLLLKYIEDTDLWKLELPKTKELSVFINIFEYDFKTWSRLVKNFEVPSKLRDYVKKGKNILQYQDKLINWLVNAKAEMVKFEGIKTLALNSPLFDSQAGNKLAKKNPPMGIVWSENEDGIKVSLRSVGDTDVSKIAVKYGGGGHKNAAGFTLNKGSKKPWKII